MCKVGSCGKVVFADEAAEAVATLDTGRRASDAEPAYLCVGWCELSGDALGAEEYEDFADVAWFADSAESVRLLQAFEEVVDLILVHAGQVAPGMDVSIVPERSDGEGARRPHPPEARLRDRVQAVIYAYETGLVAPGSPH